MYMLKLDAMANEKRPSLPHVQSLGFQRPINDLLTVSEHALESPMEGGVEIVRMLSDRF